MVKPAAKREVVGYLKQAFGMSERRACSIAAICRATQRYRARRREVPELRAMLLGLAREKPKYGYRFLHRMLRRRGFDVNHKRVYRMYREEGLELRRHRRRRRYAAAPREAATRAVRAGQRWSMDFVSDHLASGRRFRVLTIVDTLSRRSGHTVNNSRFAAEATIPLALWFLASCGAIGAVGACFAAIIASVMQRNAAQKLDSQRATDAKALEQLKAGLVQKLDDQRADDAQAIEHLKAQLTVLTQLNTSGEQKRAEVAGEALGSLLRMLGVLEGATSHGAFIGDDVGGDEKDRSAWVRRDVEARDASVRKYQQELRHAWDLAEVYLPDGVNDLFERVHQLKVSIRVAQGLHASHLGQSHVYGFFRDGFGEEPQKKIADLRAEAKRILRPLAQLRPGPSD
jgi:putative transposase